MTPEQFRAGRRKLGLTQAKLGAELGLTERHIRNMEHGRFEIERRTELSLLYLLRRQSEADCNAEG